MRPPPMTTHPREKPSMSTPSLHSRLILADQTSLSILGSDTAAMVELYECWLDIEVSLEEAIANGTATPDILALASKVASRTAYIAGTGIALYQEVGALNASFSDMRALFHELSLEDKPSRKTPTKHGKSIICLCLRLMLIFFGLEDPTRAFPLPAYIKPAYEWLLANLHNPYPSKDVKRTMSAEAKTSITYIENWFTDVRKKIGWTTLLKSHFYSRRSLIVEAATRTFRPTSAVLKSSVTDALPPTSEDFDSLFHQIEDNAKNLYVDKLYETGLALKVVESASVNTSSLVELESQNLGLDSFSSPSPSPSSLSSCSSPQPEESHQNFSRKRRSTRSPDMEDISSRSCKRTRYASPQETICSTPTNIPSPSLSAAEIRPTIIEASPRPTLPTPSTLLAGQGKRKRQSSDAIDLTVSPMLSSVRENSIPISNSIKRKRVSSDLDPVSSSPPVVISVPSEATPSRPQTRKRRLSDVTGERPTKRPHSVPSAPRLQTVSDPYPMSKPSNSPSEFDIWWSSSLASGQPITLGLPEPIATELKFLDDSRVPLDITWNSGAVIPPVAPTSADRSWTELLQDGVGEIDSIFTNLLDPKAFEQQFDADLLTQDMDQNLFAFDANSNLQIPINFAPDSFLGASLNLGYAPHQSDLAIPRFDNIAPFSLPNAAQLLQPLHEPVMATAPSSHVIASNPEDQSAKAAKIQRLREELMRLEAEVV